MGNAQLVNSNSVRLPDFLKEQEPLALVTVTIDSAATDPRNTGETNILSPGLALGKITASGKYTAYKPTASDGTETAQYILYAEADTKSGDPSASVSDIAGTAVALGHCDSSKVYDADGNTIDSDGKDDLAKGGSGAATIIWD